MRAAIWAGVVRRGEGHALTSKQMALVTDAEKLLTTHAGRLALAVRGDLADWRTAERELRAAYALHRVVRLRRDGLAS
jgi:hypothetical protein